MVGGGLVYSNRNPINFELVHINVTEHVGVIDVPFRV